MEQPFQAIPITDRVYWVGAIDWNIRDFHGYSTSRGTTYNAFLILAEKVTLIDAVKKPFKDELLARIATVIDPKRIRYIVSNHSEMDHSGCLPEMMELIRPEKVFASAMGAKALRAHFGPAMELAVLPDGGRIEMGDMALTVLETRMLHWPDSMIAYLEDEQLLFSQDAFGMHLATSERYEDELDPWVVRFEAAKYFANILLPYSHLVQKLLARVRQSGLKIRMILPDHGPVWRREPERVLALYDHWAEQKPTRKAIIAFDTMWGSTDLMARALADGLKSGGADPKIMPLGGCHRSDVATELLEAGAFMVGSPTLNANMYPTVADLLYYLRGLKRKNLVGAAFGSYGWACKAVPQINEILDEMGIQRAGDGVTAVYIPNAEDLGRCFALGREIAARLTAAY
jgi:flavorubredoxin